MTVGYEVRDRIAFVSFRRVEKHNALRDSDIAALTDALRRFDGDDDADIAILHGEGRSFSSGGDVEDRLQRSMDEGDTAGRTTEGPAFRECRNWKPVIAAVHGYCLGHALGTALLCDLIVAGRDARFQVTETKIGLPMAGWLASLGAPGFAMDVLMTGRFFSADEALRGGMVSRVVDQGDHLRAAEELAREILGNPQRAVRALIRARRTGRDELAAVFTNAVGDFSWTADSAAQAAVAARAGRRAASDDTPSGP